MTTEHRDDAGTGRRRDDADGTGRRRGAFWTSLPGVLTGIAAIMAASGTLTGAIILLRPFFTSSTPASNPTPVAHRAELQLSAPQVRFGSVSVGQGSAATIVTLINRGQGAAKASVTLTGVDAAEFKVLDDTCSGASLSANSSCQVQVAFGPRSAGDKSAALRFDADNADRPPDVALTGTGVGVAFISFDPPTVSINLFALSNPPTTGTKTVTISNTGTGDLRIGSVLLDDPSGSGHFAIAQSQCNNRTLSPGQTCQVIVRFSVTTLGQTYSARLLVSDDAPGSPQPIALSGSRATLVIPTRFPKLP